MRAPALHFRVQPVTLLCCVVGLACAADQPGIDWEGLYGAKREVLESCSTDAEGCNAAGQFEFQPTLFGELSGTKEAVKDEAGRLPAHHDAVGVPADALCTACSGGGGGAGAERRPSADDQYNAAVAEALQSATARPLQNFVSGGLSNRVRLRPENAGSRLMHGTAYLWFCTSQGQAFKIEVTTPNPNCMNTPHLLCSQAPLRCCNGRTSPVLRALSCAAAAAGTTTCTSMPQWPLTHASQLRYKTTMNLRLAIQLSGSVNWCTGWLNICAGSRLSSHDSPAARAPRCFPSLQALVSLQPGRTLAGTLAVGDFVGRLMLFDAASGELLTEFDSGGQVRTAGQRQSRALAGRRS